MDRDNKLILEALNSKFTKPVDVSDSIKTQLGQAHGIIKGLIELLDRTPSGQTPYNEMAITHLVNLQEDLKELSQILQDRMLNKSENAEQMDGITRTRNALGRHIMHMANYGIPTREEFIKIRHELHRFTKQIEDRGTVATEEEKRKGRHMIAQLRAYRSSNPDDPGSYANDPDGTASASAAENAENEPHGYPQGMTAIQNLLLNELKKRGFELTKISHADKERDKYPTVFMMRSKGPMHNVVEIDGMGSINGEHYKDYMDNLKDGSEDAEHRSNAQNAAIAISLQKAGKKPS